MSSMATEAGGGAPGGVDGVVQWVRKSRPPPNHHPEVTSSFRGYILGSAIRGGGVQWALAFRPVFMLPFFGPHNGTPHCHGTYLKVATGQGHRGLL